MTQRAVLLPPQDAAWTATRQRLRGLPQHPRSLRGPKNWVNGAWLFLDYMLTVPPRLGRLTARWRHYGPGFEKVEFSSRDGTRLSAWLGRAPARGDAGANGDGLRDGVVLLPGLYTSKNNLRIRARSRKILREWGFHVLTLDLRGVGESERAFSTPGWKEVEDIQAAVRYFRSRVPLRRVHLYAESLAASAAILAAGQQGRAGDRLLDGRIIAASPYADARRIVELYSTLRPETTPLGKDFVMVQRWFNGLLRMQGFKGGPFDRYVAEGAARYGVTVEETYRRSNPQDLVRDVNVPLLILHSQDDGLVPVAEARELARSAEDNPNVDVWILPWGYHCLYEMAEPEWYWRVLRTVFEAPEPARSVRAR